MSRPSHNQNDDLDYERLSAYVDGELTPSERALVDERLRTDPQAAEFVESLRGLSATLRALPRETLGFDARPAVEAAAQRRQLALAPHTVDRRGPPIADRGFKRGFVWATIAIAATLLLAFIAENEQAERQPDRQVAVALPQPRRSLREAPAPPRAMGVMTAPRDAAESQAVQSDPPPAGPTDDAPRSAPAAGDEVVGGMYAEAETKSAEGRAAPSGAAAKESPAQPLSDRRELAKHSEPANRTAARDEVVAELKSRGDSPTDPPRIDMVAAAPGAVNHFAKLLFEQGILLEADAAPAPFHFYDSAPAAARPPQRGLAGRSGGAADVAATAPAAEPTAGLALRQPPPVEVVLVEAPLEQVEDLLEKCAADTQWFSAVRLHRTHEESRALPAESPSVVASDFAAARPQAARNATPDVARGPQPEALSAAAAHPAGASPPSPADAPPSAQPQSLFGRNKLHGRARLLPAGGATDLPGGAKAPSGEAAGVADAANAPVRVYFYFVPPRDANDAIPAR